MVIAEVASHKSSRDDWNILAVKSRPEAKEMAVPSASLSSLVHRLNSCDYSFQRNPSHGVQSQRKRQGLHA
jgi:hypothetical protein